MPSMLKSALSLVLASSSLLLAAAQPPALAATGSHCARETSDWALGPRVSHGLARPAGGGVAPIPNQRHCTPSDRLAAGDVGETPGKLPALGAPAQNPIGAETPSADSTTSDPAAIPPTSPAQSPHNITPTGEAPTPFDGSVAITLESLPDGNYRYLAGIVEDRTYTNEELRQHSGSLFVLTKVGSTVTGDLLPRFGLPGICVTGAVTGNTISGAAYPYDTTDSLQDSARDIGETFEPHGSGALQIRRTRTNENGVYYAGALLDLNNFTLINAGSSLPPAACVVGPTGGRDQR